MFGGKKGGKPKDKGHGGQRPGADLANMMGFGNQEPDDDDESDLLAELAALEGKPAAKKKAAPSKDKAKVSMAEIERMAADSMRDVEDDDDDDDGEEFDENDLMGELNDLLEEEDEDDEGMVLDEPEPTPEPPAARAPPPPQRSPQPAPQPAPRPVPSPASSPAHQPAGDMKSLLVERKEMYIKAVEMAKSEGNSSKLRRFQRGLKELEGLIKKAQRGAPINEEDIPPQVAIKGTPPSAPATALTTTPVAAPPPQASSPPPEALLIPGLPAPPTMHQQPHHVPEPSPSPPAVSQPVVDNAILNELLTKQKEYKVAALKMKQSNNMDMARQCLGVSKLCGSLIEDLKAGKDVDLSRIPVLPSSLNALNSSNQPEMTVQPQQPAPQQPVENEQPSSSSAPAEGGEGGSSGPPPPPHTIMEAFQQRLAKYQSAEATSKAEGNGSKARRMGRIVKQYQDAMKAYKANRPVDYNELPCPPGFGPFPGVAAPPDDDDSSPMAAPGPVAVAPSPGPIAEPSSPGPSAGVSPQTKASVIKPSRNQKELEFLLNRQKEFKFLALQAKKADNIENARELLKKAKGLDPMIAAAENGLRVDVTQVPPLPGKEDDQPGGSQRKPAANVIKKEVEFDGNSAQQYAQVESALQKQIEMSLKNLEHYKLLGNLDASKKFQELFQSSKKDLDTLMQYKKHGNPVPKCQTVLKTFPVIRSNPHLSDSELEVELIRCINVPLPSGWTPKDMYTYVTFELPYPQEKPQLGNTTTKKETVNPEFNESCKFLIDRKNRTFSRYCKRNGINLKVFYVRGFLKSDKALGQANIKFEHFNNRCEIHECVDLMDLDKGRKAVGGKIEVKIKIREPLVDKDAEIIKENWLVLDTHLRGLDMSTTKQLDAKPTATASGYESLEVLRFEKEMFEKKLTIYKNQGKNPPAALIEAIKSYQQKIHYNQTKMKEGGRPAVNEYIVALSNSLEKQRLLAQDALKKNDKETAKLCLTKKKLIEKELAVLKQRLGF